MSIKKAKFTKKVDFEKHTQLQNFQKVVQDERVLENLIVSHTGKIVQKHRLREHGDKASIPKAWCVGPLTGSFFFL